jgi:phosphoglucosamine mutase
MGQLFGTDGIRGKANQYPMTCEIALKTGRAVGEFCKQNGSAFVIIGKDTRISGDMLEAALSAGVTSTGVNVLLAGVIPTPGIAFLCRDLESIGAGIVISASHNPYQDNGIKIFKKGGTKLSDDEETALESFILENQYVPRDTIGKISVIPDSLDRYTSFLTSKFPPRKQNRPLKLIIDCSNGAASKIAHQVFAKPMFDSVFIHDNPNGININADCGSQHTDDLKTKVAELQADIGLAFDGDADRLIVVDEKANEITGDCIIAVCALYAKQQQTLVNNTVVSTIMSNIGLTQTLDNAGVTHVKAGVGDRRVLEEMIRTGAVIGGEDSGHMIFLKDHTTGDGMLSALKLLEVMQAHNKPVSELANVMTVFPQVLINVEVDASRPDYTQNKFIADAIEAVENELGNTGRVLVRYSGTQPMIRVMVEGPEQSLIEKLCSRICEAIKRHL